MAEPRSSTIDRAFELARGGGARTIGELEKRLTAEGYDNPLGALFGVSTRKELRRLMAAARDRHVLS